MGISSKIILISLAFYAVTGGTLPQPAKPLPAVEKPCVGHVVRDYALANGIEPKVVAALIKVESGWNPDAKGSSGELGLMQLMPKTALAYGVKDRADPVDNVMGGIRYLAACKKLAGAKYLRCYNGGPKGIHLPQTAAYERKVLKAIG